MVDWRLCVCACVCTLPQEKRGLLICFPGSPLKGEQDTPEDVSDLLPHPSLTFPRSLSLSRSSIPPFLASIICLSFPLLLALVFPAPRPYALSSVVLARSGLCMATAPISRYCLRALIPLNHSVFY